jgi:hypothetical protein
MDKKSLIGSVTTLKKNYRFICVSKGASGYGENTITYMLKFGGLFRVNEEVPPVIVCMGCDDEPNVVPDLPV